MLRANALAALQSHLPDTLLLTDNDSKTIYGCDKTQLFLPSPCAVIFPRQLEEVVAIVTWANEHHIALVPSGGRTGYSGGAVAAHQELVVSFEKMNRILDVSLADRTIQCEAGVITHVLQAEALKHGLFYPVNFASSGSSMIGGNIATNAGGIHVIRYGLTRQWVRGLTVVTGKGDVLHLNHGLIKNAAGYDLQQLFIGSEGTLGFIVEATLQLICSPKEKMVMLFALDTLSSVNQMLQQFALFPQLSAFEFFSHQALQYACQEIKAKMPFIKEYPFYLLLEFETEAALDEKIMDFCQKILHEKIAEDAVIANSIEEAASLWHYREAISIALLPLTPHKFDIAVTPSHICSLVSAIEALKADLFPAVETIWFGHVGDGNLHLNLIQGKHPLPESCVEAIYAKVAAFKGSIAAEHGVGLLKKPYLHYSKTAAEIAYMRGIKQLFDPNHIMNPGKIF